MIRRTSRVLYVGALLMGVASLGGCATKKFVRESVAPVAGQVQAHETHLGTLDKQTSEAMARAEAAGKLAEGKFLYSVVLSDDSMKFPTSKATLSPEATARLDAFAEKLKADNRNVYVEVQGHTDATGSKDFNYQLGAQRAEAVRRYLNQKGVALNRMGTISYGAEAPVAPNNDRDGRQQNRRVVLLVMS
jgi:outer membrane protein OmpA-like peptidoglycan-associated protein